MYEQVLGAAWSALPESIQSTHLVGESQGFMSVRWGDGVLARSMARVLGFPRPSPRVSVVLKVQQIAGGLRWVRQIGPAVLTSTQAISQGLVRESFGPIVCAFRLVAESLGFRYVQEYAALRLGRLELRLPRGLSPRVTAQVTQTSDGARTEVEIAVPLIGCLLRYEGIMEPTRSEHA